MPVIDKIPAGQPVKRISCTSAAAANVPPDDGTRPLLRAGFWITLLGIVSLIATETVCGGIGIDGPYNNAGWLTFMFAMMGIPFGLLLLVLGSAKWLRNRRLHRQ